MVRVVENNDFAKVIEIIHVIPNWKLEHMKLKRDGLINAEAEVLKKELEEDYPGYKLNYIYPQKEYCAPGKYEEAVKSCMTSLGLEVTLRAVGWKN